MHNRLQRNRIESIKQLLIWHITRKGVLKNNGIDLTFSEYALDFLAENGYDPQFGARPLKRLIQKEIINPLSKKILGNDIDKEKPVLVDVFDGTVVFRNDSVNWF